MPKAVKLGNRWVGEGYPTYIIGEIGINHNGDLDVAKELIREAKEAGLDAVKFQKRTPAICVPPEQQGQMRETPWGYITYLDYPRCCPPAAREWWRFPRPGRYRSPRSGSRLRCH